MQNIWDKTYKHWQILIKTTGSFSGLVSGNCRPGELPPPAADISCCKRKQLLLAAHS